MERSELNPMIRKRDNYKCCFCKCNVIERCSELKAGNTIHHIVPRRFGGGDSPDNLITICPDCHQTLEIIITRMLRGMASEEAEILSNKKTMAAIKQSMKEIKEGKTLPLSSLDTDSTTKSNTSKEGEE